MDDQMTRKTTSGRTFVEFGEEPENGMKLHGFECQAVIEGRDLKETVIEQLRAGDVGFRKAVRIVQNTCLASFDESKRIVLEMRDDFKIGREREVLKKNYPYTIRRVFWARSDDVPSDPRYFKLDVIDVNSIDPSKFKNDDGSLDIGNFIRQHLSPSEKARIEATKGKIVATEDVPERGDSIDSADDIDAEMKNA